jgi:hypothetical protein
MNLQDKIVLYITSKKVISDKARAKRESQNIDEGSKMGLILKRHEQAYTDSLEVSLKLIEYSKGHDVSVLLSNTSNPETWTKELLLDVMKLD